MVVLYDGTHEIAFDWETRTELFFLDEELVEYPNHIAHDKQLTHTLSEANEITLGSKFALRRRVVH